VLPLIPALKSYTHHLLLRESQIAATQALPAHRARERLNSLPMSSIVAFNKDAFPSAGDHRRPTHSFRLPKQALLSCERI